MADTSRRVAVLIDADNVSPTLAAAIVAEAATHGTLGVKRIYGDWTSALLGGWKQVLARYAIQPQQQFAYTVGKNATDSALIIDAMDLLYAGNVDAFCIVANDSDYTRLAVRLRESGRAVYGLGNRTASSAFQNACDRFTFLEIIEDPEGEASAAPQPVVQTVPADDPAAIIKPAIRAATTDTGWASLSAVGQLVVSNHPTFDSRNYGFAKLSALVATLAGVDSQLVSDTKGGSQVRVRLAPAGGATPKKPVAKRTAPAVKKAVPTPPTKANPAVKKASPPAKKATAPTPPKKAAVPAK